MKVVSPELQAHLARSVTSLTTCWKLQLKNGTVLGFTAHTSDIIIDGVTYDAKSAMVPSQFKSAADLTVDNFDTEVFLSEKVTADMILNGDFDGAECWFFSVNYEDLTMGLLKIAHGFLGEMTIVDGRAAIEFRSLLQKFQQAVGRSYLAACDAELGDVRCGVDLSALTETGVVTSFTSRREFVDTTITDPLGYFDFGLLTFTSGANLGRSLEVSAYNNGSFELFEAFPSNIEIGDTFEVYPGCDKSKQTCITKFSNFINFRGFPDIPGNDHMGSYV